MLDENIAISIGDVIVKVDEKYFRPAEVETLLGDPSKAKKELGWYPKITLSDMIEEMVIEDLHQAKKMRFLSKNGFSPKQDRSS